jgi:predicted  nucleic acid-binding Zn-ribbon protein
MTLMLRPTLALSRLQIYKDGHTVFDAKFHNGVNILRGQNSSGKTTVLDFIAYTLGAEFIPWKPEALLCDWSVAEVQLNGKPVTLRRVVNEKPFNPMYIFWGTLEEAQAAPVEKWEIFGFKRSASKLSFSQALMLALDLPEAQGDGASNITMHQLLRVLYADQPSLHNPIFRSDSFDSALNRETVGAYLAGVYDDRLYVAQLNRRNLEKQLQQLDAELKSIFQVLAKSEQNTTFEFLGQEILNLEARREQLRVELVRVRSRQDSSPAMVKAASNDALRLQLDEAKRSLAEVKDASSHALLEIADSQRFIDELQLRLGALDESSTARNYFGKLAFTFCPGCLAELEGVAKDQTSCSLCKNPLNSSLGASQLLRMRNELRIQLLESQGLIADRQKELLDMRARTPRLELDLKSLEQRYKESSQTWSSDIESTIEATARELGSIEQEIRGLYESQRLAETIRQLQATRDGVRDEISSAESIIESLESSQEARKQKAHLEVASTLARLLREDLPRQAEFIKAENVDFSFSDNSVAVEGSRKFSESSTVVLRHLLHLALLSASTRMPEMRLPRFMILDGIEDGGMERIRSYRLQEIIVEECSQFTCEFQLIFATSQIAPTLDDDRYVVARSFSKEARSLKLM